MLKTSFKIYIFLLYNIRHLLLRWRCVETMGKWLPLYALLDLTNERTNDYLATDGEILLVQGSLG